ncbi:speedy protein A-like [Venturia canescens]|uniref:speedy protein A-like n=1 Tax=Venturia canescens TaxID=32260 RepID=UPI001C9C1FE4|nr:speedy protein A-like [Venturia canescens]
MISIRKDMGDIMKMKEQSDKNEHWQVQLTQRRRIIIPIKQWNVDYFFKIIDEGLEDFLKYDRCYKLADKYLIAMVFMYFLRASFHPEEYTRFNFYVALYLAHDMEEDDEETRTDLLTWSPVGSPGIWTPTLLLREREELFKRIDCRAVVSRICCERLMRIARPNHPIWKRQRHPVHAGAIPRFHKVQNVCPNCIGYRMSESSS